MDQRHHQSRKTLRLTGTSVLAAIVVVLTIFCTFVRFGPFSITLALAPIVVGGALFGAGSGAILGGAFGLVVLITGLLGWDGGTVMYLMSQNAFATVLICIGKGVLAGLAAAGVYRAFEKKSTLGAVVGAGIVCPVVNTGLFILGMLVFFMSSLQGWSAGWAEGAGRANNLLAYLILGLTGVNFVIELGVNMLLAAGITRIIRAGKKQLH